MIKIKTIGGYSEVGKNATIVEIDNKIIILDMGIHLEHYINLTEEDDSKTHSISDLINAGAIPDLSELSGKEVIAIAPSHAHLDHLGAIQYLSQQFDCPIIATAFTAEVLKVIFNEEQLNIPNKIITVAKNSKFMVADDIYIEFIEVTHSTPDASILAIHSKYGTVIYANDFKLDKTPTYGKTSNIEKLEELKNVKAMILESLYANTPGHCPSESVAKEHLRDEILDLKDSYGAIIFTTFSSHISRLKALIEIARKTNRKIIFLGRSLWKYTQAASNIGYINLDGIEIAKYGNEIKRKLKYIADNKEDYIIVCTGHQGEPNSVLGKIASGKFDFKLDANDSIIFSCTVIPTETSINNRKDLEKKLNRMGINILLDVHVSGHGYAEDLKDLIRIVNPEIVIPSHGTIEMQEGLGKLAEELGYKRGENLFILENGKEVIVK